MVFFQSLFEKTEYDIRHLKNPEVSPTRAPPNYGVITDKVRESLNAVPFTVATTKQLAVFYVDRLGNTEQVVEGMGISHATKTIKTLHKAKEKLAKPQKAIQHLLRGQEMVAVKQSNLKTGNTVAESSAISRFETDTDMDDSSDSPPLTGLPRSKSAEWSKS